MLDEQEAQIYVFESFQQCLPPYETDNEGEILSEFLCVCCEHWVQTPIEELHNTVQYWLTVHDLASAHHSADRMHSSGSCVMKCVSAPYTTFICIFIAVHSCSTVCDNPLHKSIFLTRVLPQEMHSCYHTCPSVSCFGPHLAKVLWLYKLFSLSECTDPQPMSKLLAVCNSNLSVLLHQTIYSFNAVYYSWLDGLGSHHQYLFCHSGLFPSTGKTNIV